MGKNVNKVKDRETMQLMYQHLQVKPLYVFHIQAQKFIVQHQPIKSYMQLTNNLKPHHPGKMKEIKIE